MEERHVQTHKVVYVKYQDHVLFKNTDSNFLEPSIRETVGLLIKQTDEALFLVWDHSLNSSIHERVEPSESGLVILKSDVIELREVGSLG